MREIIVGDTGRHGGADRDLCASNYTLQTIRRRFAAAL